MKWQNSGKIVAKIGWWLGGRVNGRTSATRTRDPHHVKFVPLPFYLIDFINYQHDFNAHLAILSAANEIKDLTSNSGKAFLKFETRGFESIATNHDTSKNNNLAISQNQKTTSNSLKTPVSAYSLHTLIILCALLVSGCDQKNEVKEYLIDQGMTEIKTGGYDLSSCNSFELYATPFKAVQDGKKVSGVLCARYDFKKPRIAYKKIN